MADKKITQLISASSVNPTDLIEIVQDGDNKKAAVSLFSGLSGYSGTDGISGFSGFSGYSGTDGISGFSGFSGYSGTDGISGTSGFSGYSGASGGGGSPTGFSTSTPTATGSEEIYNLTVEAAGMSGGILADAITYNHLNEFADLIVESPDISGAPTILVNGREVRMHIRNPHSKLVKFASLFPMVVLPSIGTTGITSQESMWRIMNMNSLVVITLNY